MAIPRTYATAGAFRTALEERLKSMSQTEQIDINRLRRQVSFDRLLARFIPGRPGALGVEGRLCTGTPLQVRSIHNRVRMISREQQFAEKIHAYTLPRSSPNSRAKDLVDLALPIADNQLDRRKVINALHLTFDRRGTHALPASLSVPPPEWQTPFRALAEECGLQTDVAAVFYNVREFLENVLVRGIEH